MWYLSAQQTLESFKTDPQSGLSAEQVRARQKEFGFNEISEKSEYSFLKKLFSQLKDLLVILLIFAAIISFLLGDRRDALVILAIIILNTAIGLIQEYRAENDLKALKRLSSPKAKVIRDNQLTLVATREIVAGDLIVLEAGDQVPADARLLETNHLQVSEALLTGESMEIEKKAETILARETPVAERLNTVFKDTLVLDGRGRAVVIAIGSTTEIGKISQLLKQTTAPQSPLRQEVNQTGRLLSLICLLIIAVTFIIGTLFYRFKSWEMLTLSLALAVAAIPESLPAIITITLSRGASRLAKKKAVVKKLSAVESLGNISHILTDKTGTLTQNKMSLFQVSTYDTHYSFDPNKSDEDESRQNLSADLKFCFRAAILSSNATAQSKDGVRQFLGDSLEAAILERVERLGFQVEELRISQPRVLEIPYSPESKFLLSVNEGEDSSFLNVFIKGAPEIVLASCRYFRSQNENKEIDQFFRDFLKREIDRLAASSLRIIAVAYQKTPRQQFSQDSLSRLTGNLTFLGLLSFKDPLRPEAKEAIQKCREAGITTVMVTGDLASTATAVAKELGLIWTSNQVLTGAELNQIEDKELIKGLDRIRVFARVDPTQKLRLVGAFKKLPNARVAVTGDGVNDAPSLKNADVGVAMGLGGTDVAREVSDLVLQDDNFATIVTAVSEGRVIYSNLVKSIHYLISCNLSEILIIFTAIIFNLPSPLTTIQILWINLITDSLPALALGTEKAEFDLMKKRPLAKPSLLNPHRWRQMVVESLLLTIIVFLTYLYGLKNFGLIQARTLAFVTIVFSQLFQAFNSRSETNSVFKIGLVSNPAFLLVFLATLAVQFWLIQSQAGQLLFSFQSLGLKLWLLTLLASSSILVIVELRKLWSRISGHASAYV